MRCGGAHTMRRRIACSGGGRAWRAGAGALLAASIALAGVLCCDVYAQALAKPPGPTTTTTKAPPKPTSTLTTEQLQARLDAVRRELDAERTALAQARRRRADEAAAVAQRRQELADRLLATEIERERNAAKLRAARDAAAEAKTEAKALSERAAALAGAIRAAADQLRLHLGGTPGNDEQVEQLQALAGAFFATPADGNFAANDEALETFLTIVEAAHRQATSVGVTSAEIFTASGQREMVELLAVGHVRFAYLAADGRVGVSIASPAEASGYRWTENVDATTQQQVRTAIEQCRSSTAGVVSVPIDPAGRLSADDAAEKASVYQWFVAGGFVMLPLACVAVAAVVLIVERAVYFLAGNPSAERLASGVLAACRHEDFEAAEELCARRRGVVARVLGACLARRQRGQQAMEDAVGEQLLNELPRLQRFLGGLATLAGVAPLLGLLGTVTGIIQTFAVIRSFGNSNPSLMAGGISEALITTAAGLLIAVPVVVVHSMLRSRCDRIVADAERHAATLLMAIVHPTPVDRAAAEPAIAAEPAAATRPRRASRAPRPAQEPSQAAASAAAKERTVDC